MSNIKNFKIIYHFSLLYDIVLFGKRNNHYFICVITKIPKGYKKANNPQSPACIYIKDNDNSYYCIQVSLLLEKNEDNKSYKKWFLELIEKYALNIYENLLNNSSKLIIKEKNKKFLYFLYDIPAYIWCVVTGMIVTKL